MESTREYVGVAETAKLIRAALKRAFPGTKFRVHSKSYAGGASVNVGWDNGPRSAEVSEIAKRYQGASFDASQDLKEYHDSVLVSADGTPRRVHFGADFVFCDRNVSDEVKQAVVSAVGTVYGMELPAYSKYGYPLPRTISINFYEIEQAIDLRTNSLGALLCHEPGSSYHTILQESLSKFLPKV